MGLVSATKNKPTTDKLALYHDHSASFTASTLSLLLHHISRAGISRADISRADALDPLADALSPLSLSLAPLTAHISDLFHDAPSRFPLPSLSLSLAALSQLAPDSPLIPHMAALVNDNSGKIMIVRPFPHLALSQLSTFFAAHPQINSAPFFASIEAASSIVTAHCPAASLLPVETAFAALSHPSPTFTPSLATKRANMSLNSRAKTLPTHEALSLFFDHPFSLSSPPDIYNLIHLNYLLSETSSNPRRPSLTALTLKTTNQILYSPLPPLSALSKLLRSLRSLPDLPPSDRGTCALADVSSALDQHAETIFNTGKSSDMTALVHFIATNPPSDPPRNALPPLLSRHLSFLTEYASVHEISTILRAQATLPYSKAHDLYPPLCASLATWCPRASPSEMTHLVTTLCASPASCWRIVAYLDSEAPWYCASEDFRLVCKAARSLAERGYCTPALIAACVKKIKAKQRNARSSETRGSMMTLEEMRDLATAAALGPPGTNQTNVVKAISPDLISRLRAASRHSYFSRHACDLIWALAVIDPRHPVIPDLYGEILADPAARGHALLDDQRIRKLNEARLFASARLPPLPHHLCTPPAPIPPNRFTPLFSSALDSLGIAHYQDAVVVESDDSSLFPVAIAIPSLAVVVRYIPQSSYLTNANGDAPDGLINANGKRTVLSSVSHATDALLERCKWHVLPLPYNKAARLVDKGALEDFFRERLS